jgi:hypothetical protein
MHHASRSIGYRAGAAGFRWMLLALAGLMLAGCGSYQLKGKVVAGEESTVAVVAEDDPRFNRRGIEGVSLSAILDPQSLDHEKVGSARSGRAGRFALPVDAMGAGFLEHEVMIAAVKEHYATATRIMPMPGSRSRLLIVLAEGESTEPRLKGDMLDETLEMGEQYME